MVWLNDKWAYVLTWYH